MNPQYSYQAALEVSERGAWRVDDIIGGEKRLDFTKPFMPENLAQATRLSFLSREEQRILNQIRGYEYLSMFGLVEEFILPYVVDHARSCLSGDDFRIRALLQICRRRSQAYPPVQDISPGFRSRVWQQVRVHRPRRRREEIRSIAQPRWEWG